MKFFKYQLIALVLLIKINTSVFAQEVHNCYSSLQSFPNLQILKGKVALTLVNASFEMLGNTRAPNKLEKKAIIEWDEQIDACNLMVKNEHLKYNSNQKTSLSFDTTFINLKSLRAELYSGKLSFGEYEKKRLQENSRFRLEFSEIEKNNEELKRRADAKIKYDKEYEAQRQLQQRQFQAQQDLQQRQLEMQRQQLEEQTKLVQQQNDAIRAHQNQQLVNQGMNLLRGGGW